MIAEHRNVKVFSFCFWASETYTKAYTFKEVQRWRQSKRMEEQFQIMDSHNTDKYEV